MRVNLLQGTCTPTLTPMPGVHKAVERTGKKRQLFLRRSPPACVPCMSYCWGVKVPRPGKRGTEGQAKRKGVTVRWGLKEAWSAGAGRRTGTGYEVGYVRDEWARNYKVLHPQGDVLYKSGVYALKGVRLTTGDLV